MSALAGGHDAAVQMIDTSIVRVHQHGACITRNRRQSIGRSQGGLTSKIHALVDTNGLPVRLALTAGEAHDNRLAERLLSRLKSGTTLLADRGYDADWIRALVRQHGAWANIPPKRNRTELLCFSPYHNAAAKALRDDYHRLEQWVIRAERAGLKGCLSVYAVVSLTPHPGDLPFSRENVTTLTSTTFILPVWYWPDWDAQQKSNFDHGEPAAYRRQ
jgi:transposase